jgi:hypothetical protein
MLTLAEVFFIFCTMWNRYPIRALKFIAYFYVLLALMYIFMHLMGVGKSAGVIAPDWQALLNRKMILGVILLGVTYPLIGFKVVKLQLPEGGLAVHGRGLRDAAQLCGFKLQQEDDKSLHFVADNAIRRVLSVYEDNVEMIFDDETHIRMSGLRRDIARIELRIRDYLRNASLHSA